MRVKYQIFISSTFHDLKEERQAAVEAILSAGHIPAGMELFNAGNDSQLDTIKRWINESDIYMLILGGRYGSIDATSGLSYTEIEYRYAIEKGKPVFAIYISEASLNEKTKKIGKEAIENKFPEKLEEFRKFVLSKICRSFDDVKDVKISVLETLNKFSKEYQLPGWVSGTDIPNTEALLKEISDIRKENVDFQTQLNTLKNNSLENNYDGLSYIDLCKILKSKRIKLPGYLFENRVDKETELLSIFVRFQSKFNIGVDEEKDYFKPDDPFTKFLFKNCAPILFTFGLVEKDKKVKFDKFITSNTGIKFLSAFEKNQLKKKTPNQ